MNKIIIILITLFISTSVYSSNWKTITANNFKVHYEVKSEYIAKETIKYLIEIDSWLTKYMKYKPKLTNVVIADSIDDANGFARIIPYNLIHIYPYPPEAKSVLGYYDNWLYILVLHEYLHIVHIDTKGKLPEIINSITGKLMAPNQVLPKFITEGLAVYFESLATQRGRLNSPLYKMMFRSSILNNNISLSELSNNTSKYPYGGIVYLYGSFFINYLFKYDDSFKEISSFSKNYGDNIIPYGINRALKHSNNKTFDTEYHKFIKFYKDKFNKLYKKIKAKGITKYKRILKDHKYIIPICDNNKKHKGKNISDFTISNDGFLYILSSGPENLSYLYKYNPKTEILKKTIKFNDSVSNIEVIDDKLYYIGFKINENRTERRFSSINLDGSSTKIEIKNLRVVNFAFNKDNYNVALVVNEYGIENIYAYNLKSKILNKLTNFKTLTTIGEPHFINNNKLLISMNHKNKLWNLYTIDLKNIYEASHHKCTDRLACAELDSVCLSPPQKQSPPIRQITNNNNFNISPIQINNKIYFISDKEDDILNIYSYNTKNNELIKKTNFFTGIKKIIYNENMKEFYALRFQEDNGYEIILIKENDLINKKIYESNKEKELLFLASSKDFTSKTSDFSIFPEILPKNVMPQITASNFENSIGVEIINADVRDYYTYSIFANYIFDIEDLMLAFYFGDYSNYVHYSLGYSYTPIVSDTFIVNNKNTFYNSQYHTFSGTLSIPFYNTNGTHQIYFSASNRYYAIPKLEYDYKPWDTPPVFPEESDKFRFSLGYYFSNTQYLLSTPGNSEGDSLNLRVSFRDKELLATYNTITFAISYKNYIPMESIHGAFAIIYNMSMNISEFGVSRQYIGGYPDYGTITDKMIDRTSISGLYLRGYPQNAFSGASLNILNLEYRQHLFYTSIGHSTIPFYINKFYLRFFYDIANITDKLYELSLKKGMGVELSMQFLIGYFEGYNLSLGYAKGLDEDGENQFYLEFIGLY